MTAKASALRVAVKSGVVEIAWNDQGLLIRVGLDTGGPEDETGAPYPDWIPSRALKFLDEIRRYFDAGTPISQICWSDIELSGWSDFQKKVYQATLAIPHGETRTYGWVASKLGAPQACRAVGQALRKNPVPILVPCHRVVSNQSLGGFMGEDNPEAPQLDLKRLLLDLESGFVSPTFWSLGA